ncbi:MAG TPA: IS110 family transposase [Mycobacterium sp.]
MPAASATSTSPADSALPSSKPPEPYGSLTHFGAVDWARGHHDLCVVDAAGKIVVELSIQDTPDAWAQVRARVAELKTPEGSPAVVGFAIETSSGPAVERLLEAGWAVFPLNPKAAERYRDRKSPSGSKSDRLDAFCFADALRTDGHAWRVLRPQDPLTCELRLLCRDEISLIGQRTALVNQIQAALNEYYPTALAAFDDWTACGPWEFVIAFPTPHHLASAGKRKWEKFLHAHKLYRPATSAKRLELFAQAQKAASPNPAVTAAKSLLAVTLAKQLRTLEGQLQEYRARINELFAKHPDRDLFGSLPGAGGKLAPRLLAELGADRQVFQSPEALQCYAGAAPVTQQSGRSRRVFIRRACNMTLRATVHLWADRSRVKCPWAEAYYRRKRQQGVGHADALRRLAMRWLKILWKMWTDRTPYDAERHLRDQVKHGSWVIALLPETSLQPG